MSTDSTQSRPLGQRLQRGFESHVLVPLAVTVVSAATHNLARKLPLLLEEKVLPKLREQGGAEGVRDSVARAAAAVEDRVTDIVPGLGEAGSDGASDGTQQSNEEREQERREREERRSARRRSPQRA